MTAYTHPGAAAGRLTILSFLITLLVCCFTLAAQAQTLAAAGPYEEADPLKEITTERSAAVNPLAPFAHKSAAWWELLDKQLAYSLNSRIGDVQEKALQVTASFSTRYHAEANFSKTVPELVRIYECSRNERHRIMALSALHGIGDPYGMQRLRELASEEPSEHIRHLTNVTLAEYEGTL